MNCDEFRQQIDAAPGEDFDGRDAHLTDCESCTEYAAHADSFEDLITRAMRVPVPSAVSEISLEAESNVIELRPPRSKGSRKFPLSPPAWIGLAAGVVLAAFIGLRLNAPAPGQSEYSQFLAAEVLSHMVYEPGSRVVTAKPVAYERMETVIEPAEVDVSEELGLISYAMSCVINGNTIPHLVVQGRYGPVTILIMPEEKIEAPIALENAEFHGSIIPVGDGSVAIIGRRGEAIDDIRNKVGNAIRLSI